MVPEGQTSPIGSSSGEARRRRTTRSAQYRSEAARLAPYEGLARMVIARRIRYGLTQRQLAARMGTSVPAISRIESGQHRPNLETLEKLGQAFGERFVFGFEDPSAPESLATIEEDGRGVLGVEVGAYAAALRAGQIGLRSRQARRS